MDNRSSFPQFLELWACQLYLPVLSPLFALGFGSAGPEMALGSELSLPVHSKPIMRLFSCWFRVETYMAVHETKSLYQRNAM